jgi:hypothetical protein
MFQCQNGGFNDECQDEVFIGVTLAFWLNGEWSLCNERRMCPRHAAMEVDFHKDVSLVSVLVRPLTPVEKFMSSFIEA